jgi:hypothetical protein
VKPNEIHGFCRILVAVDDLVRLRVTIGPPLTHDASTHCIEYYIYQAIGAKPMLHLLSIPYLLSHAGIQHLCSSEDGEFLVAVLDNGR